MKQFLSDLRRICKRNLVDEKVLIVPSYSGGRQIIQALVRAGSPCINLKAETMIGLAEEICRPYLYKNSLETIPAGLANHFMLQILKKLSGSFKYFNNVQVSVGFSKAILRAVSDLKMAGITTDEIDTMDFVTPEKGLDIKTIFNEYQSMLKENQYVDVADLYTLSLQYTISQPNETVYILPSNLKLQKLEVQFLQHLTGNNAAILNLTAAQGIIKPSGYINRRTPEIDTEVTCDADRFSWLFDLDNANPPFRDGTVEIFQAYGESNEVREIIRRIKTKEIPIEQAAIFYPASEPYSQLLFNFCKSINLPITFGDGVNIKNTRPGRLFFGLLEWIESNYDVLKIHQLITSGNFMVPGENAPSTYSIARILRSSAIGWGRDRYIYRLQERLRECKAKFEDAKANEGLQNLMGSLQWVIEFVSSIFDRLPIPDDNADISYRNLIKGLIGLLNEYARVTSEADAEARNIIIEELSLIANQYSEELPLGEAISRLKELGAELRVNRSSPQPGHIHVCHYSKGVWVNRPFNFIIGLDAHRFPGPAREDAILLDTERKKISGSLFLKQERPKDNTFEMAQLLASLNGNLIFSYSAFDTTENRELFPSSLLLQIYRLQAGDKTKDYSQLLASFTNKKAFIPSTEDEVLDEADWWLTHAVSNDAIEVSLQAVVSCYENIGAGLRALEHRLTEKFTPFDGNVKIDGELFDPRRNHELIMSCSQLEKLATCPFGYYLSYILGVRPPDDIIYDPGIWLDPASRGTLLHSIFERFYKELKAQKGKPSINQHENFLYELADELITEQKQELPPPSEVIYEHERRELLESCRVFLATEEEHSEGVTPCRFELSFGLRDDRDEELGEIGAVPIEPPNGDRFYLRGKIDRVDRADDNTYKTLDYKTGSTYAYSEQKYYKGGRQLQHTLYAIVLEKILTEKRLDLNPCVSESGYIFPTVKGEGVRIMRRQDRREELYEILGCLMDILASGTFNMTNDSGDCRFCDYIEVCQRQVVEESVKQLFQSSTESELESFRRLRNYE